MSALFILRNPLSQLVAKDICHQEGLKSAYILYDLDQLPLHFWSYGEKVSLLPKGLWCNGWSSFFDRYKVKQFLLDNSITRLFVTYPLHFRSSYYVKVARSLGVGVYFFEEGTCFYRSKTSDEYNVKSVKDGVKKLVAKAWGLEEGYDVHDPDGFYALLPNSYGAKQLEHVVTSGSSSDVEYLYLSRPLELDYSDITVDDQISVLRLLLNRLPADAILFIKFHPRDSGVKRAALMQQLGNVEELIDNRAAEDILSNMNSGAVYAFETATLAYSYMLNSKIKAYSLLPFLMDKDTTGMLAGYYSDYSKEYPWIEFLQL